MQLRFLKGDWEFGKYKLQYIHPDGYWDDVPTVLGLETEKSLKERLVEKFTELHPLNYEHLAEVAVDFFKAESQKEPK